MSDQTTPPDDDFAAAFAELNPVAAAPAPAAAAPTPEGTPTPAPAPAAAAPAPAAAAPTPEGTPTPAPAPAAAAPTPEGTPTPAPAPAAEGTPTPTPAPTPAEPTIASLMAELEAVKTQLKAQPAPAAPAPAPAAAPAPAPAPVYNTEETATLAKYREDWPDVAAGEALVRRAEYQQLTAWIFDQIRPTLEQLTQATTTVSTRSQYQEIVARVPDYDAVRDKALAWIDTQPDYLKDAYLAVTEDGTPDQVADLIKRFKTETGYVAAAGTPAPAAGAPAAAPAAAPATPAAPAGLPPAAAAAAAALKVVPSGRTTPVSAPDPNDFDGAFAEFAKQA